LSRSPSADYSATSLASSSARVTARRWAVLVIDSCSSSREPVAKVIVRHEIVSRARESHQRRTASDAAVDNRRMTTRSKGIPKPASSSSSTRTCSTYAELPLQGTKRTSSAISNCGRPHQTLLELPLQGTRFHFREPHFFRLPAPPPFPHRRPHSEPDHCAAQAAHPRASVPSTLAAWPAAACRRRGRYPLRGHGRRPSSTGHGRTSGQNGVQEGKPLRRRGGATAVGNALQFSYALNEDVRWKSDE
jgi:hypothetical protein